MITKLARGKEGRERRSSSQPCNYPNGQILHLLSLYNPVRTLINHLVEDVDILWFAKLFSDFPPLEHQEDDRKERQNTAHASKEYKFELISDAFGEEDGVERKCHADFLTHEVEQRRHLEIFSKSIATILYWEFLPRCLQLGSNQWRRCSKSS